MREPGVPPLPRPARPARSAGSAGTPRPAFALALLVMLFAAVFTARIAPASADPAAPGVRPDRAFGESIGLVVKFHQGQPASDLQTLIELGVRWVRDGVSWTDIETAPGRYAPTPADFAARLAFYRRHDIGLVYTLAYQNDVAYPASADAPLAPIDPDAYGRYAAQMARRLQDAGVRFALAVWNEPHNFVLRPMLGGAWNGRPPSPWVDHYVRMVEAVVREVKAVDPSIPVMTDDDMWVLHYWFLDKGLPAGLDGFAVHPYTRFEPEKAAVRADTDWTAPHRVVDDDASFRSAVRRLREAGERGLGRPPRLWITEWGYASSPPDGPEAFDPFAVAAYLPRAYVGAFAAGLETTFWFSAHDSVDGPMGLIDGQGRQRPAYRALATLTEQLGAYRLLGQWGEGRAMQGRQVYLFRHGDHHRLVFWQFSDHDASARERPPMRGGDTITLTADRAAALRAVDVFGRPIGASTPEGRLDLPINAYPVYLSIDVPPAQAPAVLRQLERQFFPTR